MGSIPTIRVVNPLGGFMIINESDYNPEKHVLPGAKVPAGKKTEPAPEASEPKKSLGLKLTMEPEPEPDDNEPEYENEAESEEDEEAEAPDLRTMTIAELKDYARRNEIDLGDKTKKADLIRVIEKAISE